MTSTVFQDYNQNNPIVSSWLNDVNKTTYSGGGLPKTAVQMSSAWVRFSLSGITVVVQQSSNILSVVRNTTGQFTITYQTALTNTSNCYSISQSSPGFVSFGAETANSVVVNFSNPSNVATDPSSACVVIYGAN